jgi:divalent metal cation (Fe/Co/Zn/Cd) transporter
VVAITLAIETKSLLLGESASWDAQERIEAALNGAPGIERIIHMKTLHLGPEELLVAAKIGVSATATAHEIAAAIDAAEQAIREVEATAQVIYLEPDIYRQDYVPAERPEPPPPAGH